MTRTALAALFILIVTSPLWGAADNPSLGAHGIGSYWTYTVSNGDTLTMEMIDRIERRGRETLVMEIGGNISATRNDACQGYDEELYDAETGNWVACLKNGKVLNEVVPHDGRFSFPMAVGDLWVNPAFWINNVIESGGTYTSSWEVIAYESVTVSAGTFMAFRIDYGIPNASPELQKSLDDNPTRIWYAPTEKFWVKTIYNGDTYELSDYSVTEHVPELTAIRARISVLEDEIAAIKAGYEDAAEAAEEYADEAAEDAAAAAAEAERMYCQLFPDECE